MPTCKIQKRKIARTLSELLWRMVEARSFVLTQNQFMDFRAISEFLETNEARNALAEKTITDKPCGNPSEIQRVAYSEATYKKGNN